MKRIDATLPALGGYSIPFYKESEEVLDFVGEKELSRLDRVEHLGVAAKVFTGVNHSRLEYLLLQCAIINMLPRFHKGNEQLALSGGVRIPGQKTKISSGEELLKSWALLSNLGHAKYTYGVERSLLNHAREDTVFRDILVADLPINLRRWSLSVINRYRDSCCHYLLTLQRIESLPKRSRVKARLYRLMAALVIPDEEIDLPSTADRYKLLRLRRLFSHVRLLSIVSLDAYYSHHPVRYQLSGALMNLGALLDEGEEKSAFLDLMERTAAWLADEIYLHPLASAAQRSYELQAEQKLRGDYSGNVGSKSKFQLLLPNIMENGFGQPRVGRLKNLARLSFPYWRFGAIFARDEYRLRAAVQKDLGNGVATHISVITNPYSKIVHIDLLYESGIATCREVGELCSQSTNWVRRLVEAQALRRIRVLRVSLDEEGLANYRERALRDSIEKAYPALKSLFDGVIRYVLPWNLRGSVSEVYPGGRGKHLGLRFDYERGGIYDTISDELNKHIANNPKGLTADRVHEMKALRQYISKSKAPFIAACLEKYLVKDAEGVDVDDWDGVVLEVYKERVVLSVIEAKNLKSATASENRAFKQLETTREIVRRKHPIASRRRRLQGLGAVISFEL